MTHDAITMQATSRRQDRRISLRRSRVLTAVRFMG